MKPNNQLKEYVRIMNCVDVDEAIKEQIIINCARHSTLNKIKAGKYRLVAVRKENTVEKI